MKEYVALLTEKGLLGYDKDSQTFRSTEKGLRFLEIYKRIVEIMMMEDDASPSAS